MTEIEDIEKAESWKSLIYTCTGENKTENEQNNQYHRATEHQNQSVDPRDAGSMTRRTQLSEQNNLPGRHMATEHQNQSSVTRQTQLSEQNNLTGQKMTTEHQNQSSMNRQDHVYEQNNLPGQYLENYYIILNNFNHNHQRDEYHY